MQTTVLCSSADRFSRHALCGVVLLVASLTASVSSAAEDRLSVCVTNPTAENKLTNLTGYIAVCQKSLELQVVAGESHSAGFYLTAKDGLSDLTITSSDLISPVSGIKFSKAIDARFVKSWFQATGNWSSVQKQSNQPILTPELLLKNDLLIKTDDNNKRNYIKTNLGYFADYELEAKLAKGAKFFDGANLSALAMQPDETRQIWLTVKLPKNAWPGTYTGQIQVVSKQKNINLLIPVTIKVQPFHLLAPVVKYSIYYRGLLDDSRKKYVGSEYKTLNQLKLEFKDMISHGVSNPTIYQNIYDLVKFRQVLGARKSAGMDNKTLYLLGITTDAYNDQATTNLRKKQVLKLWNAVKDFGVEQLFVYGIDEAQKENIPKQYPVWDDYRKAGLKIFSASYELGDDAYIAGKMDLVINGTPFEVELNRRYKNQGTQVYLYNRPQVGKEDAFTYRKNYGIMAWQVDADGVMDYAYQHSMGQIWNDFDDDKFRDHVFAYPTSDGLVGTIQWEGFMEGVNDVKYLSTLIKLAETTGDAEQLSYIKQLKTELNIDPQKAREQIAERIVKTCEKYAKPIVAICQ